MLKYVHQNNQSFKITYYLNNLLLLFLNLNQYFLYQVVFIFIVAFVKIIIGLIFYNLGRGTDYQFPLTQTNIQVTKNFFNLPF